jgi:conjugal transfer mating pair stabilization protein TraG
MYHQYGEGHTVIDSSGAISQLPFKASMTRGYASDLRNQGQWYMNEAERIENGTSATWSSSRGTFGSAVAASSEVSGSRASAGRVRIRHPQCRRQCHGRGLVGQVDARSHE